MKYSKSTIALLLSAILMLIIVGIKLISWYQRGAVAATPSCFTVSSKDLCINTLYRPGAITKTSDSSNVRINADRLFMSSNWVRVYIYRYGNHRDDPGAEFYDYAVGAKDNEILKKIEDNDEYSVFKDPNDKPGSDVYLFLLKATGEKFIYQCIWDKTCTIKGTYNGKFRIDVSYNTEGINRRDLKKVCSEFIRFKSTLFQG